MSVDTGTLRAWRLESQRLGSRRAPGPARVVEWLVGVQAQDHRAARWSVGLRTDGAGDEEVERAIQKGQIVRTWMFRGTLHLVAAGDLAWLNALLAPGIIRGNARRYRELALDEAAFETSQKVLRRALEANGLLSRSEIRAQFDQEGVPAEGQRLVYLLQRAALDGLICHGPQRGNESTFVPASSWAAAGQARDRDEALGHLAGRYLSSHGPATAQDFAWWSGLPAREARLALSLAADAVPVEAEGARYWATGDPPPAGAAAGAHLLPAFDEYLLGYKDRSLVLEPARAKQVNAGGGMLRPTVVVNGEIAGTWSHTTKKQVVVVSVRPFRDLASHERGLVERAAGRFAGSMSVPAVLDLSTSDAGPGR